MVKMTVEDGGRLDVSGGVGSVTHKTLKYVRNFQ